MSTDAHAVAAFPRALTEYPATGSTALTEVLAERVQLEPFNAIAAVRAGTGVDGGARRTLDEAAYDKF